MNDNTKRKEGKQIKDLAKDESGVDTNIIPPETRYLTNVAFLLGDVMTGLLMEAESRVSKLGLYYKHSTKQRWRRFNEALAAAKRAGKDFSREMYELEAADQAAEDSDYLADMILLICDRVGDDEFKQEELRKMIATLPSHCGFYEKLMSK